MARSRRPPNEPDPPAKPDAPAGGGEQPTETQPSKGNGNVRPGMSEQEIRDAGLAIDVPFESGEPQPERLRYADLGMSWTPPDNWPPESGAPSTDDDQGDNASA